MLIAQTRLSFDGIGGRSQFGPCGIDRLLQIVIPRPHFRSAGIDAFRELVAVWPADRFR